MQKLNALFIAVLTLASPEAVHADLSFHFSDWAHVERNLDHDVCKKVSHGVAAGLSRLGFHCKVKCTWHPRNFMPDWIELTIDGSAPDGYYGKDFSLSETSEDGPTSRFYRVNLKHKGNYVASIPYGEASFAIEEDSEDE